MKIKIKLFMENVHETRREPGAGRGECSWPPCGGGDTLCRTSFSLQSGAAVLEERAGAGHIAGVEAAYPFRSAPRTSPRVGEFSFQAAANSAARLLCVRPAA